MQNNIIEQNLIVVEVKDPTVTQNREEFVVYNVEGQDKKGQFQIQHRFKEFYQLRVMLVQKWQYCYIPALPSKVIQGNLSSKLVYQRLVMLNHFMRQLSHFQFLWYSQEVQDFLRQRNSQELNQNQQPENYLDLLNQTFPEYQENFQDQQSETKIDQFNLFIQNASPILNNYKQTMKNKINFSKTYFEQMDIFQNFFISEYEITIDVIVEKQRIRQSSKLFQDLEKEFDLSDKEKQFYIMYIQIKIELNEFQVLNDLIQERKQLQKQIQALNDQLKNQVKYVSEIQNTGLNIIKQFMTTKEEELEKQLAKLKQLEQELTTKVSIFNLITNKLAKDIQFLKKIFQDNYYYFIRQMSQFFKQNAQNSISYYQNLLQQIENQGL